jgi:predicted transcriptional regulator of viral defense system
MKIRELESQLQELPVFTLNDIRKFNPDFYKEQLSYWKSKGFIKHFAGRYYYFADQEIDEGLLNMMANKIYEPSYISLESALEKHHLIPESVLGITSISSRKTRQFQTSWGILRYQSIKPICMFGYAVVEVRENVKYKIAHLEKAILDYLYLHTEIVSKEDFEGLRWNRSQLINHIDNQLVLEYLEIFNNNALRNRWRLLMEFIHA